MARLTYTYNNPSSQTVELDGRDISNTLRGITIRAGVGHMPRVELDVVVLEFATTDLEHPQIHIPQDVHATLTALGWTPPPEQQEPWHSSPVSKKDAAPSAQAAAAPHTNKPETTSATHAEEPPNSAECQANTQP